MPKIKNIIIFVVIAAVLVFAYIFLIKPNIGGSPTLSTTNATGVAGSNSADATEGGAGSDNPDIANNFLTLLLSVNSIKLDDSIFSSPAFTSLHDSSITLAPDTTPGRPDPFSPIGTDVVVPPVITTTDTTTNTGTATTTATNTTGTSTTTDGGSTIPGTTSTGTNTSQSIGTNTGTPVTN